MIEVKGKRELEVYKKYFGKTTAQASVLLIEQADRQRAESVRH